MAIDIPSGIRPVLISPELGVEGVGAPARELPVGKPGVKSDGFASALIDAMGQASQAEQKANEMAVKFAAGDPEVGIHEAMIAAEKASIALKFAVTLKNKAIEAYKELMNTPV